MSLVDLSTALAELNTNPPAELSDRINEEGAQRDHGDVSNDYNIARIMDAFSGKSGRNKLVLDSATWDVSAAELNAAAAGTFKRKVRVSLVNDRDDLHTWADFTPVLTPAKSATPAAASAPTLVPTTPVFDKGYLEFELKFDTDAGATKAYAVDDWVDVTIQVKSDDKLSGWTPVSSVKKTFTVI